MADAPRLALSVAEAAKAVGVSQTIIYRAINNGALRARKIGAGQSSKRIVRVVDLEAWLDALDSA